MNRRNLLILGSAAVVVVGGAVLLTPRTPEMPTLGGGDLAFPNLAPLLANAAKLEVKRYDQTLTVLRRGETWVLPEKGDYPARQEKMRELLVGLTELRLTEPRTANPELLDRLGLEDVARAGATSSLLRVLDANDRPIVELVIGRRRVRTQGNVPESVYVRRPNENQAWLAEGRLPVDADVQLWLDRDIANLPRERVRKVVVKRNEEAELVLERPGEADAPLRIVTPADPPPTDETSLDEVGRAFEFLTFVDVVPEAQIPGQPAGESRFELTDHLAVVVRPNKLGEALWVRLTAEGDDEAARLNARWRGWVYQIGQWKEKAFLPRLADLRREEPAQQPAQQPPEAPAAAQPEQPAAPAEPAPAPARP